MEGLNNTIKFGTEGWRDIISSNFTFNNVRRIAESISQLKNNVLDYKNAVISYDNRFLSEKFARAIADSLSPHNTDVLLSDMPTTTPNLCYATKGNPNSIGIMITSSHNPYLYNGVKLKSAKGSPMSENHIKKIEEKLNFPPEKTKKEITGNIRNVNIRSAYSEYLKHSINLPQIRKIKRPVIIDMLYGPSGHYIDVLFKGTKKILQLRCERDPLFGGINPEPVQQNLEMLGKAVIKSHALAGIAFDGDGDRLGVIDENGRYLPPHIVFPLLTYYVLKSKKQSGKILQTISLGYLTKRIAEKFNLPFQETPVGFKHLSEIILKEKVLSAGEESGGYSVCSKIPDRDGIHSGLLLLEALSYNGTISQMVNELKKEFGDTSFLRVDVKIIKTIPDKKLFAENISNLIPGKINNKIVRHLLTIDGLKITFTDDSWLMMRPSGTEPLVRIYAESENLSDTKKLIDYGKKTINKFIGGENEFNL